jgi:hypothetical protein
MTGLSGHAGGWHIKQKPLQGLLGTGGGGAVGGTAPVDPTPIQWIVIAGGGGGGFDAGGGGGAGGYLTGTTPGVIEVGDSLSVTVGAGGAGNDGGAGTSPGKNGSNGSNSVFDNPYQTITCIGGGGAGGGGPVQIGSPGGSGGGSRRNVTVPESDVRGTPAPGSPAPERQGYPGGPPSSGPQTSPGGGGAGGAGDAGSAGEGGPGGVGVLNPLMTPTNNGYVAGGGGGAVDGPTMAIGKGGNVPVGNPANGYGGSPGGGGGPQNPNSEWFKTVPAVANTGGGGGGGGGNPADPTSPYYPNPVPVNRSGGTGGPGVVILVVPDAHGFTVAPTVTMAAGYSVPGSKLAYKFSAGSGSIDLEAA